jgi:hypothetical protein
MAFEASKPEQLRSDNTEVDRQKRAMLGKLAEEAVVQLHGETVDSSGAEGEIFSQNRISEGFVRNETQLFMHSRQQEVSVESKKLEAKAPHSVHMAEAAADAVLLQQTRAELAATPLNVPAETGIQTARARTEQLIDKALGLEQHTELPDSNRPNLEGAVSPESHGPEHVTTTGNRPAEIRKQISLNENDIRERTARQFESVAKPQAAIEALRSNTSDYDLSVQEMTAIGNRITFEGLTLTQLYETSQFDETAMRRIIAEFLTGGNVEAAIIAEKNAYEGRFERDPRLRQQTQSRPAVMPYTDAGADTGMLQVLGQTAYGVHALPPDATGLKKKSTIPVPDLSAINFSSIKKLKPQQIITITAVTLFMVALIFLALALTR